jgi:hypothetical protein
MRNPPPVVTAGSTRNPWLLFRCHSLAAATDGIPATGTGYQPTPATRLAGARGAYPYRSGWPHTLRPHLALATGRPHAPRPECHPSQLEAVERHRQRATTSGQRRTRAGRDAHKAQAPAADGLAALRASRASSSCSPHLSERSDPSGSRSELCGVGRKTVRRREVGSEATTAVARASRPARVRRCGARKRHANGGLRIKSAMTTKGHGLRVKPQ